MTIGAKTKLGELLKAYPFLTEFLSDLSPNYAKLRNPVLRKAVGWTADLKTIAAMGEMDLGKLLAAIAGEVRRVTGAAVPIEGMEKGASSAPAASDREARKEILKGIIRDLHKGGDVGELKARFAGLVGSVTGGEIGALEQELIAEGLPEEEIRKLCDLHVKVFEDALSVPSAPEVGAGHPLDALGRENRALEGIVAEVRAVLDRIDGDEGVRDWPGARARLAALVESLADVEKHYLKKENQLFPRLEGKGVTGPPKVMWAVHDDIRAHLKELRRTIELGDPALVVKTGRWVLQEISDMIGKEEKVLFPMCLEMFDEADWTAVKKGEDEVGYAWIEPPPAWSGGGGTGRVAASGGPSTKIALNTGALTPEQIDLLLTHLPVDISFVDETDTVVYYSATPERIFPRSPGVIGRKVQNCHPSKSVDVVNRILESFRSGARDVAEFWIESQGRFIHIRYFAVRDAQGAYRGTLEVSQDATAIRALRGERRLLEWGEDG